MARITVPEADALIDVRMPVLDRGHVVLMDYLGGDARVAAAARTSYGAGTKSVREDRGLINYLIKNAHTSPLEQVSLVFHIKLPIFVFAQLVRHRTAKLNSMSARYSEMPDEFYEPTHEEIRGQGTANKQVGDGELHFSSRIAGNGSISAVGKNAYMHYRDMLEHGIAREQARMVLPQNIYTEIVWKIDLHNLMHFLRLRLDWHAQKEIRVYAEAMATCAQAVAPMCFAAFEEHVRHGARLSRTERAALATALNTDALTSLHSELGDKAYAEFRAKLG